MEPPRPPDALERHALGEEEPVTKHFLKNQIKGLERDILNAKQAAKKAAQRIESMEHTLFLNKLDIQDYNKVIADMIAGESPCHMCEDWNACQLDAKAGKGCSEWMLRMQKITQADVRREAEDAGEGFHVVGANG